MTLRAILSLGTLVGHALLLAALAAALHGSPGILCACAFADLLALGAALRWSRNPFVERPRPAGWVCLVEEPLWVHWGATTGLVVFFPLVWLPLSVSWSETVLLSYGAGLGFSGWAVWGRRQWVVTRRHELGVVGLPAAFDGYRLVHLTDLHVGNFARTAQVARWIARANALRPDLVCVTGDLVASGTERYQEVADLLGRLRCIDGVFVSLGNHDQWDKGLFNRELSASGLQVLENRGVRVVRGASSLFVAGLGDCYTGCDDLEQTLHGRKPGESTVLLAHYPSSWDASRGCSVALTLSGHTHGGQLALPFVGRRWNLARFSGVYTAGWYQAGDCHLYVNAGLGTTAIPMRLGVPPEIALITLRAGSVSSEGPIPSVRESSSLT